MLLCCVASIRLAHAFAPEASAAVAARLSAALPLAAHWSTDWNASASTTVESRLAAEDADPETWAPVHRYDVSNLATAAGVAPSRDAAVTGSSPTELSRAALELSAAFAAHDPARIVAAAARVAVSATDLADPFETTALDVDEEPGARAQFCDLIDTAELEAIDAAPTAAPFDVEQAAEALAAESAAQRAAIEAAVHSGDEATVVAIRRQRLSAALGLARSITLAAWQAAGSPAIDAAPTTGFLRLSPNPVRTMTTVSFTLVASGRVQVELFDTAGRRIWSRDCGTLVAGRQSILLGEGDLRAIPAGIYLTRVSGPGVQAIGRMTRVAG